jgi:hypothetical protein
MILQSDSMALRSISDEMSLKPRVNFSKTFTKPPSAFGYNLITNRPECHAIINNRLLIMAYEYIMLGVCE